MKNSAKVVAITGAARGIGKACAVRFLSDGARVVISDVDALRRSPTPPASSGMPIGCGPSKPTSASAPTSIASSLTR